MGKTEEIEVKKTTNFIRNIIDEEIEQNKHNGRVHTRFPPEPNGYLHIGHAKSICINFGIAKDYNGLCNLRFDDTNPGKEDIEYVNSIQEDIKWLGFDWGDRLFYTSDYFDKIYNFAIKLIKAGKAYVCDLTAEEMREYKGSLTSPGKNSPYRNRSIEENINLFERMKNGEFKEGTKVLRAKIDMASPNINFRDPVMYRIIKAHHHRTGDKWNIYPSYDFAHGQSDSIEEITNSICTLEFEDHRPLYNWFIKELDIFHSRQIEFARLNLTYTVMSKRKLLKLVEDKLVSGWDDPRMPTLAGLRRRGYTPESIRTFCDKIGVAKSDSTVDISFLEFCLREDLNKKAFRVMAVTDPVKVVITNYPKNKKELLKAVNNQNDENCGSREIPFGRELYIERDDFMIDPPKKFFRLTVGKEVRLLHAYYVTCTGYDVDENGKVTEIRCTYDPETRGGWTSARKVKGTLHWVSKDDCFDAQIYNYDRLFTKENPYATEESGNFLDNFNKDSLQITTCKAEPSLINAKPGSTFQFLRTGYFTVDSVLSKEGKPVFNKTVGLKDSWSKKK